MNHGGFSWKRFLGVTRVKQKISRTTGIPMSKSGLEQKVGRLIIHSGGCSVIILIPISLLILILRLI